MIVAVGALLAAIVAGYLHNREMPLAVPISNLIYGPHPAWYHLIVLMLAGLWIHLAWRGSDRLLRILAWSIVVLSLLLAVFTMRSGAPHIICAAGLIVAIAVHALRTALLAGDLVQVGLAAVPLLASPIMISLDDRAVALVEGLALGCIGTVLCLDARGAVIHPADLSRFVSRQHGVDPQRLFLLGGLWLVCALGTLAALRSDGLPWYLLLLLGVCMVPGAYIAFRSYRPCLAVGGVLLVSYVLPAMLCSAVTIAGHPAWTAAGTCFATVAMLGLTYVYDEYAEDII